MAKSLSVAYGLAKRHAERKEGVAPTKREVPGMNDSSRLVDAIIKKRKMAQGGEVNEKELYDDQDEMEDATYPMAEDSLEEDDEEAASPKDVVSAAYAKRKAQK